MVKINHDTFLELYQQAFGALNDSQRSGLDTLLGCFEDDEHMQDLRWIAYCMATAKWECGDTWHPISEYSKGKGQKYGTPDPVTHEVYFGRGWVQLTWAGNYRAMGEVCGVDLYRHPDLAMQPDIAYKIMSHGMRHGTFTGAALKRFFDDDSCDWVAARRIINGTDQAERIAGFATKIYEILKGVVE